MSLLPRYWIGLFLGLLLILATGLLSLSKIRKTSIKTGDPETKIQDTETHDLPTALGDHSASDLAQVLEQIFVRTGLDAFLATDTFGLIDPSDVAVAFVYMAGANRAVLHAKRRNALPAYRHDDIVGILGE